MDDNLKLKIESYIGNFMSKEEALLFEKQIKKDGTLQKEVALAKELNQFLRDDFIDSNKSNNNEFKKEIKKFLKTDEAKQLEKKLLKVKNEYKSDNLKPKKKKYFYAAAVVAFLFMSVLVYNNVNQSANPEKMFTEYYSLNDLPSIIKRDNYQDDFIKGVLKLKELKYSEALALFNRYKTNTKNMDKTVFIYTGITNMELENYDNAIVEFDKMIESNLIDHSKGLWFKALLYLKKQDKINAKNTLEIIVSDTTNFKFKAAKELLDKL